ncbi:hypothetical protein LZ32DRAFT_632585 [Colletotrichum eremochloae]|nr:hypothetical protein LZ32DRAFT_632585 [Colletotrichum eremochloae]
MRNRNNYLSKRGSKNPVLVPSFQWFNRPFVLNGTQLLILRSWTGGMRANLANDGPGFHHLPDNIQTKILGNSTWFDKTLGCIMMAQNLGSTAAWLGWITLTNHHGRVNQDLGLPVNDHRLSTMWLLSSSISFLLVGRLSDLFGRRWLIVSTCMLGLVGSVLGSMGGSIGVMITSNICNGVATAVRLSFGFVVGEIVAALLRPFIAALVSTAVMSNALYDSDSRGRWSHGLEIGCAFISIGVYFLCYFPPTCKQLNVGTRIQMAKDLDITGIFLFMFSCFLTMLGLSPAGAGYQWESKDVAGPLLGAVLFFVVFFIYEAFLCRAPVLMPPRLLKNRHYFVLVINALSASVVYLILYVAWPTVVGKVFSRNSYEIAWHISMLASIAQLSLLYLAAMKTDQYAAITTSSVTLTGVTYIWEAQDIGLVFGVLRCLCSLGCAFIRVGFASILD